MRTLNLLLAMLALTTTLAAQNTGAAPRPPRGGMDMPPRLIEFLEQHGIEPGELRAWMAESRRPAAEARRERTRPRDQAQERQAPARARRERALARGPLAEGRREQAATRRQARGGTDQAPARQKRRPGLPGRRLGQQGRDQATCPCCQQARQGPQFQAPARRGPGPGRDTAERPANRPLLKELLSRHPRLRELLRERLHAPRAPART